MQRKIQWQLIALVFSVIIFGVALLTRITTSPPTLTQTATPPATEVITSPIVPSTPQTETVIATPLPIEASTVVVDDVPTLREGLVGKVQRLNPLYASLNPIDADVTSLIFEGLIAINEYGEPIPQLAESWVISSDGLEYVFSLRQDILWQDGIPFTADDVLYTMSLLQQPAFDGQRELGEFWRTIETEKLRSHVIRFRLAQPLSSFLANLTVGILPEHALRGTTAETLANHPFNLSPIGTGAYQLEALRSSDGTGISQIDLRVSPNYRQRPEGANGYAIERIRFMLFSTHEEAITSLKSGAIDAYSPLKMIERLSLVGLINTNTYTSIAPTVGILVFNWEEGEETRFFREQRVRIALQRGLNRTNPVEANLSNQAILADSPILTNTWGYKVGISYPSPDVAQALGILQNANMDTPNVSEGVSASDVTEIYAFSIIVPETPSLVALAREVATQWSQLKLNVTVEPLEATVYKERLERGEFQVAITELDLNADPDVFAYWHVGQAPDGKNYGAMADDRLSELLERARRDPYSINRMQLYYQFQDLFTERAVAIPLYYPLFTYNVNKRIENVQLGFINSPSDRFRSLKEWQVGS